MRDFVQPRTLTLAACAALVSTSLCYPRLAGWSKREDAVWFLELSILCCTTVLWGFVFAWHIRYTERPVFIFRIAPKWLALATAGGCVIAAFLYFCIDPTLRQLTPDDYPADLRDWLVRLFFSLGLTQLLVLYAPFDWLMRLSKNQKFATVGTIIFGIIVLAMGIHSEKATLGPLLISSQILVRIVSGYLAIQFYLRGGLLLACWFTLVLQARHLLNLH
jgi:hypothetical protein